MQHIVEKLINAWWSQIILWHLHFPELACATCHLVFEQEIYDTLPEKEPEEDDMLDLAMELTDTSRLGCQICVRQDMDGMRVQIPDDGY